MESIGSPLMRCALYSLSNESNNDLVFLGLCQNNYGFTNNKLRHAS